MLGAGGALALFVDFPPVAWGGHLLRSDERTDHGLGRDRRRPLVGEIRSSLDGHHPRDHPLAFLSGTFYSVERLPGICELAAINPLFHMIDGFAIADRSMARPGGRLVIAASALVTGVLLRLLRIGYKLKHEHAATAPAAPVFCPVRVCGR